MLGRGAMGEVWKARHTTLGTQMAVKLVAVTSDAETTTRLLTEARAAASIVSPNVVRIYDHGNEGTIAFIAMELCLGETLSARLRRVRKLSPQETVLIARDIAQGISVAHRAGIIHRDLKPDNVFLARGADGNEIAKVLDFGIAKSVAIPGMQTQQGIVVGTPAYLSREQVLGSHPIDEQTDLWALSIVIFECIAGHLPYSAATIAELFVQIVGFGAWFMRATAVDPAARFDSARTLAEELARVLAPELPIVPWEMGTSAIRVAHAKRKSFALWVIAALAALAVALCVLVINEAIKGSGEPPSGEAAARLTAQAAELPKSSDALPGTATSAPLATSAGAPALSSSASASSSAAASAPSSSASAKPRPKGGYNRWGL
jgi:serine/threonine protein kinase